MKNIHFTLYLNTDMLRHIVLGDPQETVIEAAEYHAEILFYQHGWTIEQFEEKGPIMTFFAKWNDKVLAKADVILTQELIDTWRWRRKCVKREWDKWSALADEKQVST